jgi:hypothetical protein
LPHHVQFRRQFSVYCQSGLLYSASTRIECYVLRILHSLSKQLSRTQSDTALSYGRVIAQAPSRRLPTASARVRAQVKSCGICGG